MTIRNLYGGFIHALCLSQKFPHIDKILQSFECATAHGGQLIIAALAKEFGLWKKIAACPLIPPRHDPSREFSPEAIVAQWVFNFCRGGVSLNDGGRLGTDKALGQLLGMDRWANATPIGEWLRGQSEAGLREFGKMVREFVGWVMQRTPAARVRRQGGVGGVFRRHADRRRRSLLQEPGSTTRRTRRIRGIG